MLRREENELVTRIGAGTAMGDVVRRYWIPAALSSELPSPDCPPIRVRLLGERLVAFRDTRRRVGLLEEFCAHRRASLFLGRNEECGLRCVYHGWKYDVEGSCVDMPNEPPESSFKEKVHLKVYPTVELGGLIWAYMGPKEKKPELPKFEWTQVLEDQRFVMKTWQECNWLQALEGGVDGVHSAFLHRNLTVETTRAGISPTSRVMLTETRQEVSFTDYGLVYWSFRSLGEEGDLVRNFEYVMPIYTYFPARTGSNGPLMLNGRIWVPMDDENTMVYNWVYTLSDRALEKGWIERRDGRGPGEQIADFRKARNRANNWLVDRKVQKTETYTGIEGINAQDHAIQESMGPIVDRSQEHLGSTDKPVIAARRLLLQAVKTVQTGGDPVGTRPTYYEVRSKEWIVPPGVDWQVAVREPS